MLVKIVDELLDAACTAAAGPSPAGEALAHRAAQALVAGQPGARGQHLGGGAAGRRAPCAVKSSATARGRVVVRREGGVGVGEVAVAEARDRVGRDLAAHEQGGAVGDAGDDGGAAQACGC